MRHWLLLSQIGDTEAYRQLLENCAARATARAAALGLPSGVLAQVVLLSLQMTDRALATYRPTQRFTTWHDDIVIYAIRKIHNVAWRRHDRNGRRMPSNLAGLYPTPSQPIHP